MSPNLFKNESSDDASAESRSSGPSLEAPGDRSRRRGRGTSDTVSVFGSGLTVEGEVRSRGDLQIEGEIVGNVSVEGQVSIAGSGDVEGEIVADRVVVAGNVQGSIEARESARLVEGANVTADIHSPRLQLEDGATMNGRVDMSGSGKKSGAKPEPAPVKRGPEASPGSGETEGEETGESGERKKGAA